MNRKTSLTELATFLYYQERIIVVVVGVVVVVLTQKELSSQT